MRHLTVALVASTCLVATAGMSHASIILGSIAPEAAILQLPDRAATGLVIVGTDPTIGQFTFTAANRLASDAATDRITGLLDFEDLSFRADDPGVIVGLSFQFGTTLLPLQSAEVIAFDQSGRGFSFTFPGPISGPTTVSLLATGGDTIGGFRLSSPVLARTVGPFRVVTAEPILHAPEPSTLAMGLVGIALAGLGWRRRRAAA